MYTHSCTVQPWFYYCSSILVISTEQCTYWEFTLLDSSSSQYTLLYFTISPVLLTNYCSIGIFTLLTYYRSSVMYCTLNILQPTYFLTYTPILSSNALYPTCSSILLSTIPSIFNNVSTPSRNLILFYSNLTISTVYTLWRNGQWCPDLNLPVTIFYFFSPFIH